jgi:hypothetical protein
MGKPPDSGCSDQTRQYLPAGIESVLTDTVLSELKSQSINGCLLRSFDTWDEEEWD